MIFLFLGGLLGGCAPIYTPNVVNAPFHREPGEAQLSGHFGTSGVDAQAAVSVSEHLGIMGNYSYLEVLEDSMEITTHYHEFGEVGVGYYNNFGGGTFEFYGGYGYGEAFNTSTVINTTESALGDYSRYFLQADVGSAGDVVEGGLTLRGSYVDFHDIYINGKDHVGRDNAFFLEPAATLRVGYKYLYITSQFGFSIRTTSGADTENHPEDDVLFDHQPFIASFGLNLKIGEIVKGIKGGTENE